MVVSFGLEAYTTGSVALAYAHVYTHFTQDSLETLKLMVPGLLYTVQNNLMFVSLANLSMAVQQALVSPSRFNMVTPTPKLHSPRPDFEPLFVTLPQKESGKRSLAIN